MDLVTDLIALAITIAIVVLLFGFAVKLGLWILMAYVGFKMIDSK